MTYPIFEALPMSEEEWKKLTADMNTEGLWKLLETRCNSSMNSLCDLIRLMQDSTNNMEHKKVFQAYLEDVVRFTGADGFDYALKKIKELSKE